MPKVPTTFTILQRPSVPKYAVKALSYIAKNGPLTRDAIMDMFHLFPVEFDYLVPVLEIVGCGSRKTDLLYQVKDKYLAEVLLRYG